LSEYDPPTLRLLRLALVLVAAACAWPAAAISNELEPRGPSARVGIFYYPWFATPSNDGRYAHWQQGGMQPPADVASSFYPVRGVYSSADALVVDAQMREIAAAGIGVVITSWWGRDSREDRRLPQLLGAARRHGLSVAAHLEPYRGRTVESTEADIGYLRGLGISDVYV
jgi:glycoprotein endo-alpha-1,2-mannosidase